jgi:hypothetical protein
MKPLSAPRFILTAAFATLFAASSFAGSNLRYPLKPSGQQEPVIAAIKGRKVRVEVPEGFDSVTLQRRTAQKKKPWITLSSETLNGAAKEVVFTLRTPMTKPMLRVFGKQKGKLPSAFYTGTTNFLGETVVGQAGGNLTLGGTGGLSTTGAVSSLAAGLPRADSASVSSDRTVTESDIWKVDGDRLYFFNSYRGLQNIDISDVAAPALLGTLRMPAAGEDMYQLDSKHVAILKRTPKELGWTSGSPTFDAASQSGEIVVCDVSTPEPTIVARVPYEGSIANSRLIGNALVIARNVPRTESNNWSWRTDLEVTGYDLSTPTAPVVRNSVKFAGTDGYWVSAVQASNECFMVARPVYNYESNRSYYSTDVHLVDVSNPNGTLVKGGSVTVEGYVDSKFKLHENGGVMSVVSAFAGWEQEAGGGGRWTQFANLQNFDVSNIAAPKRLGGIEVGHNESTRAVRFDGDRAYIVTVVQQDPLWIIDNADPANPTLSGELHVPGFSSYIEPLGDRLVTVGRIWGDDGSGNWQNRTAVSLYDVADPTKPKQLSQLPVGTGWSHSEAEWDEKAFTVLPDAGLIMLPYSSGWWHWGNGGGGVQLVDLNRDSLALRGVISHGFTPRRTTVKDDAVIAVSAADLLTVDIADRDNPVVKADVELAWNVNRVWIAGKHLLQLGQHLSDRKPVLSVAPIENADDTLSTLELGDEPVQAAELKGDLLYIVQTPYSQNSYGDTLILAGSLDEPVAPVKLSVFSIASLPNIVKLGTASASGTIDSSYGEYDILFPTDATAVVAKRNRWNSWYWGGDFLIRPANTTFASTARSAEATLTLSSEPATATASLAIGIGRILPWGWGGSSNLTLTGFDVSNPRAPKYLTTTKLDGLKDLVSLNSGYSNHSEAFAENGKVFSSFYTGNRHGTVIWTEADGTEIRQDLTNRYFLNVVDYADPAAPVVAKAVSIPGELRAVTRGGDLLYVVGPGYDAAGKADSSQQFIHATAFDGTAHLVDSIPFGSRWSGDTFHVGGGNLFLNRNSYDSTTSTNTSAFEAWTLGDDGKFVKRDSLDLANANGWSLSGDLAIIPGGNASLRVVNLANPSDLQLVGTYGNPATWWWYSSYGSGSKIVGDLSIGFWIPEGDYGVKYIPAPE